MIDVSRSWFYLELVGLVGADGARIRLAFRPDRLGATKTNLAPARTLRATAAAATTTRTSRTQELASGMKDDRVASSEGLRRRPGCRDRRRGAVGCPTPAGPNRRRRRRVSRRTLAEVAQVELSRRRAPAGHQLPPLVRAPIGARRRRQSRAGCGRVLQSNRGGGGGARARRVNGPVEAPVARWRHRRRRPRAKCAGASPRKAATCGSACGSEAEPDGCSGHLLSAPSCSLP